MQQTLKRFIVAVSVFGSFPLSALQPSQKVLEMREAEAYFEAQMYPKARERFQNMLQEPLEPWERAIIIYNLGNVWLAAGEWEQAVTTFQSVPLDNHLAPLLSDRIQRNLMLTYLRQAVSILKTGENEQAIELLNKVIGMASQVDEAKCGLERAEGSQKCTPSFDALAMKLIAREYLAVALNKQQEHYTDNVKLREGLESLLLEADDSVMNAAFVEKNEMPAALQKRYRNVYFQEQTNSLPLWTALKQKLENDKQKGSDERMELFISAAKAYGQGSGQFNERLFAEAGKSFEESARDLKKLIAKLPPPPPSESSKKPTPPEKPQRQQQSPQESAQEEKGQEDASEKAMQILQRMEQADQIPKSNKPIRKKELRPW